MEIGGQDSKTHKILKFFYIFSVILCDKMCFHTISIFFINFVKPIAQWSPMIARKSKIDFVGCSPYFNSIYWHLNLITKFPESFY